MNLVASLLYNLLLHLALPLVLARLWWRGRREPGYREDWAQRFGIYPQRTAGSRTAAQAAADAKVDAQSDAHNDAENHAESDAGTSSAKPLIWLHAVSLGETLAAGPLVLALRERYPQHRLLITHMTATGRAAAQREYGAFAELAWLPYDFPWAMRRFFNHFAPAIGIVMETEVWPNLAQCAQGHGVRLLLANARLSERSARSYQRAAALLRPAFAAFDVCAQTAADAERLKRLGVRTVSISGNLKFDTAVTEAPPVTLAALRALTGTRPVFLAASTREGEEALLLDGLARAPLNDAITVIVPRHPQRFDEVAVLLEKRQIRFVRRSAARVMTDDCTVLLGDSMGEMSAYFALADCAFIGGSLVPVGGQNMIEACALGVPALYGPHTFNFAGAAAQAVEAGAAQRIADADELMGAVSALLGDAVKRSAMGSAGRAFCATHRGATARTMKVVAGLLAVAEVRR